MQYASSGSVSTIFEINMGMVDRGADLSWVSQYPHEEEICFAPLTGLEVTSTRVENSVLVVAVRLNIRCVSNDGGALIGKALGRNTMLETFHINGGRYTELSGEAFADAIEANVTLKELNLGHNECALTPESQKRIDRVVHSRGGKLKVGIKR